MNVNALMKQFREDIGYDVEQDVYTGKENIYFTWNVYMENCDFFVDDTPIQDDILIQLHLFISDKNYNYLKLKKKARAELLKLGFSYADVVLNTVEYDTKKRHICFEAHITQESEREE